MRSRDARGLTLVTGAAGKTGMAVIRRLLGKGVGVRAVVHRSRHRKILEELGVNEVVRGDLCSQEAVSRAVNGVDSVYHICPNVHPDEIAIGRRVITAACASAVTQFVLHSVLHPQTEAMPHHWAKLRVEELLLESDLAFTILQPAPYMQNILSQWERITQEGVYAIPYRLETRVAMVDLEDVAEVAGSVLTEPRHLGATYELCGPDLLDQIEIAGVLSQGLDREVLAEAVPLPAWTDAARAAGLGGHQVGTLVKMFRYYERFGMTGSSCVLGWLLGRPPTGFAEFVDRLAGGVATG